MKTILRKIFMLAAALLLATAVHAYDFSAKNKDGVTIRYNILSASDKTCEVVGHNLAGIAGFSELNIPETVEYESQTYTVTRIASANPDGLGTVIIPNSVTSIAPSAFKGCKDLQRVKLPDFLTSIEESVFEECIALINISIPSSVKYIGNRAFYNCKRVYSLVIPNTVTSIGEYAFYNNRLTSIEIPNSVTTLQNNAFSYCEYLTSVKLSNALTSISVGLFSACRSLTSIEIPNSVTSIGQRAFESCDALTSVKIPESVTSIGNKAFYFCGKLTSIDIPNSVTEIGNNAFQYCSALSSVHLSNSLSCIETSTFESCRNLSSIVIPASVTSIGDNAFKFCSHMTSVDIPNSVTEIGMYAFNYCEALPSVRLPNSLKTIKNYTFNYCTSLTSIDIPNSVTSIGKSAFEGCKSLTSVTLSSSIESIGELAFASCNALVKVDTKIENPFRINENVFSTQAKNTAVLHVPVGKKLVYRATEGWSGFVNLEDDGTYFHLKIPSGGSNFRAFCHDEPLDFSTVSGLKAYIAGGFDPSTNEILLVSVNEVPAGTGVILEGVAGNTYDVLVNGTSFVYSNLLKGTLSQTTVSEGYVLRGDHFERVESSTTVAANSAYLTLPASVQGPSTLSLKCMNGVTDDIDAVVTDVTGGNGHWYTLQGMRLDGSPSTPGIYIRNGRKVMVR